MTTGLPAQIGRYRILDLLGQGAMGTVYRGRDESLERDVAIKVMSLGLADHDARMRFLREGKAAARLQHPNIVTIYELGEHEGRPFMALELLEGMDLQRAIEAGVRPDPRFTLPIVLHLLAGLGHAHEHGIVHRDVKPSNLFLPRGRPAKIMDFGVARLAGGQTTAGAVIGTPNYMSPEQARGGTLDGRSDLFSAGLILFELVTGEKAYTADSVVALLFKIVQEDPDFDLIPKGEAWKRLGAVLRRSLQKKPEDRYPDARAMSADLEQALRDLGGSYNPTAGADQALLRGLTPKPSPVPTFVPAATGAAPAAPAHLETAPGPALPEGAPAAALAKGPLLLAGGLFALGAAALAMLGYFFLAPGRRAGPEPAAGAALPANPPAATSAPAPPFPTTVTPTPSTARPTAPALIVSTPTARAPAGAVSTPPDVAPSRPAQAPSPAPEPAAPSGPSPAEARIDRANAHMENGRYAQALAEAKAVLARDPRNADAKALAGDAEAAIVIEDCVRRARAALKAGDRETALAEAKKGLAVNPSEKRLLDLFREATQ